MKPYYEHAGITIYHGDCRDVLCEWEGLRTQLFDALVTDPPYGIEAAKACAHSSIRDNADWPKAEWDNERCVEGILRAIALTRHAAVWGGNFYADILAPSAGWLAWIKPEAGTGFSLADMELCWTTRPFAARVKHAARRDGNEHPTQKPVVLMLWTMRFLKVPEGGSVLDPFMGSGSTLFACKRVGYSAVGIDREERYCEIAAKRLAQEVLPLEVVGA